MYWYNKRHWSYFSHAYFAQGKKSLTFYLAHCCCLHSGKHGPHWKALVCLLSALTLHHHDLSKRKDSGFRMSIFSHSYHSNSKSRKGGWEARKKVGRLAFANIPKIQTLFRGKWLVMLQSYTILTWDVFSWRYMVFVFDSICTEIYCDILTIFKSLSFPYIYTIIKCSYNNILKFFSLKEF